MRSRRGARELREWFRAYVGDHAGRALSPVALDDLGVINSLLALDHGYGQIEGVAFKSAGPDCGEECAAAVAARPPLGLIRCALAAAGGSHRRFGLRC